MSWTVMPPTLLKSAKQQGALETLAMLQPLPVAKNAPAGAVAEQLTCETAVLQVAPRQQTPLGAQGLGVQVPPAAQVPVQLAWNVIVQAAATQQVPVAAQGIGEQTPAAMKTLVAAHWVLSVEVQVRFAAQHAPGCGQALGVHDPPAVQKVPVEKHAA